MHVVSLRSYFSWAALAAIVLAPLASARAQETKPVLIVSISPVQGLLDDVKYLAETVGQPEFGGMAQFLVKGNAAGVDFTKPAGILVVTDGIEFKGFGFIPVTNFKQILAKIEQSTGREPRDAGNGVLEIAAPQRSVFVKEAGGFAYIAAEADHLKNLPADPVKLLGDLPKRYDIAVSAFVHNIPQNYRDIALAQMRAGYQQALDRAGDQDEDAGELMKAVGKRAMEQWGQLINELDRFTYGLVIDSTKGSTYLETEITAIDGSKLAQQFNMSNTVKSDFTGFRMPGAAVNLSLSQQMGKEDVDTLLALVRQAKDLGAKKINDEGGNDAKDKMKVFDQFMAVIEKTVQGGKLDGGAALILSPPKGLTLVGGGRVVDGPGMEQVLKTIVDLAKDEPDFPGIKWNAAKHGNVTFHTMSAPVDDPKARDVLGAKVDIVLGIGPSSFYFAAGKDALATIKQVIDKSAAGAAQAVTPIEAVASLKPILQFLAAAKPEDENLARFAKQIAAAGDKDKVKVTTRAVKNGAASRIEVEEGVIKAFVPRPGGDAAPGF